MKTKTLRKLCFTVRGSGVFPFDMLRYDRCRPAEPEDALWIGPGLGPEPHPWELCWDSAERPDYRRDTRELMLVTYLPPWVVGVPTKGWIEGDKPLDFPTDGRWRSFSWKVTQLYEIVRVPLDECPEWAKKGIV